MKRILSMIIAFFLLITIGYADSSARGIDTEELLAQSGSDEVSQKIPEAAKEFVAQGSDIKGTVDSVKPQNLIETIKTVTMRYITAPLRMLVSLCGIILLCAMLEVFHTTLNATGGRS
ncbi:MAG: hypothetical protein RR209_02450, partial [Angelakisella sp.]